MRFTRSTPQRYDRWHPYAFGMPAARGLKAGWFIGLRMAPPMSTEMGQPAGPVVQRGSDHPYQGMDPSDPLTFVRPYRPARGMIGYLNYDGAQPNKTQTVANPPRFWDQNRWRRAG